MFANYGKLSTEVYELTKPVGTSINGDIDYYRSRLHGVQGKVLEAGVGTGRMLVPLLQAGFDIEGVDYSVEMLKVCQLEIEKRNLQSKLYQQDLTELELPVKYDAIMMPTGSFGLIENRKKAKKVLAGFYDHINKNGKVVIDLEMPYDFEPGQTTNSLFKIDETTGIRMENSSLEINWIEQKTMSILKYEKWDSGKLIASELQNFTLTWYGIEEFKMLLSEVGFSKISCSSNYQYEKQPINNDEIITFEGIKEG